MKQTQTAKYCTKQMASTRQSMMVSKRLNEPRQRLLQSTDDLGNMKLKAVNSEWEKWECWDTWQILNKAWRLDNNIY